jgi:hypothetical protein
VQHTGPLQGQGIAPGVGEGVGAALDCSWQAAAAAATATLPEQRCEAGRIRSALSPNSIQVAMASVQRLTGKPRLAFRARTACSEALETQ